MSTQTTTAIDDSEGFNYETVVNANAAASIDLSDKTKNDAITDNIVNSRDGLLRPYIAGKIEWDNSVARYCLTHDASKSTDGLKYQPFASATGNPDSSQWFDSNLSNRLYEDRDHSAPDGRLGRGLTWESPISTEISEIQESFSADNHNSYAYQINRHPDFVQDGVPLLDIGDGPGIPVLDQQTGVWTTRVIQGNRKVRATKSPVNSSWVRANNLYASCYIPVHPSHWPYIKRPNTSASGHGFNHHGATSFMIKLNEPLSPGEYIPICTYNSIDRDVSSISDNITSATGWGIDTYWETRVNRSNQGGGDLNLIRRRNAISWNKNPIGWDTVSAKVANDTGCPVNQYSDNFLQWYNLTCNTLVDGRRNIHDVIIFLGKPKSDPTIHQLVVWYAGGDGIYTATSGSHSVYNYKYYPSSVRKINITKAMETQKWIPVFFHHMTEKSTDPYGPVCQVSMINTSNAGTPVFACNGGIWDYNINESVFNTSIDIGFQTYTCTSGRGATIGSSPAVREHNSGTFLSYYATKKISIADLNYNIDNNQASSIDPTTASIKSVANPTYFPSATITYEGVNKFSALNDISGSGWSNIENIKSFDTQQEATLRGIGQQHALQVFVNPATAEVKSTSVIKSVSVDIRGIRKRFINPNLSFNIALYKNNNNPDASLDTGDDAGGNPVDERISAIKSIISLDSDRVLDDTISIKSKLDGSPLLYEDLDPGSTGTQRAYFKIWASDGNE